MYAGTSDVRKSARGGAKTSITSVSSGNHASCSTPPGIRPRSPGPHDHLRVLGKPRFVLDAARNQAQVAGTTDPLVAAEAKLHLALEHPEDLLVRMLVSGRVRACLHRPPHDHFLVAGQDAARDLVRNLLLREICEGVIALHARHGGHLLA